MSWKPKKSKNLSKFQDMKEQMKHLKAYKVNHHVIVHKYLMFYLYLKTNKSHLNNQLKDDIKYNTKCFYSKTKIAFQSNHVKNVTTYNMKYLLKTSSHHNKMFRNITSMFTVTETIHQWNSTYPSILLKNIIEM